MSENGVTRLLLIILVITGARYGSKMKPTINFLHFFTDIAKSEGEPLECYVCTSVENSACTSSLSGIERSICTLDEVTEPTTVSSTSTTTLDSIATSTTAADTTSASIDVTSTGDSSEYISTSESPVSSTSDTDNSASWITSSTEYTLTSKSETSSLENTPTEMSTSSEDPSSTINEENTSSATSAGIETTMDSSVTSHGTTEQETTSIVAETTIYSSNEDSDVENEPIARMVRDADVAFACYTLTLIRDNETITDRGCVVKSSSMCDNLNEEKYPGYNLTTCETCAEDGCNSSAINLSGIPSLFVPLIMLILTR